MRDCQDSLNIVRRGALLLSENGLIVNTDLNKRLWQKEHCQFRLQLFPGVSDGKASA